MFSVSSFVAAAVCSTLPAPPVEALAPFELTVELARPIEVTAAGPKRNVLRIGLRGHSPNQGPVRAPVNLALVLDRSGSMEGDKLVRARQAARMVVERLEEKDILSIAAYDEDVEVLVPATRVADRDVFLEALENLAAGGSTALFAGVSRGISEVRRFMDPARVDRVVLVSDGQANIGPSAPSELGRLGAAAAKEGISVTTIGLGLGYNEDLMARLAQASDGNHGFAESSAELVKLFDAELQDALAVVAKSVDIRVVPGRGVRVLRALNRPAEIYPKHTSAQLVQLHAGREKFILLELEVDPGGNGETRQIAEVSVRGRRVADAQTVALSDRALLRFVDNPADAENAENRSVMVSTVEAAAVAANRAALSLRDQGRIREAQQALRQNADFLETNAARYGSERLKAYSKKNLVDSKKVGLEKEWKRTRKSMRRDQHRIETQQSY